MFMNAIAEMHYIGLVKCLITSKIKTTNTLNLKLGKTDRIIRFYSIVCKLIIRFLNFLYK